MAKKNYIDKKGNYQNVENLTLAQIYNEGVKTGAEIAGMVKYNREHNTFQAEKLSGKQYETIASLLNQTYKDGFIDGGNEAQKIIGGLRLLIDWAVEAGFGFDQIPEEYEKYKKEIKDMGYTEGLIYIGYREAELNEHETNI